MRGERPSRGVRAGTVSLYPSARDVPICAPPPIWVCEEPGGRCCRCSRLSTEGTSAQKGERPVQGLTGSPGRPAVAPKKNTNLMIIFKV